MILRPASACFQVIFHDRTNSRGGSDPDRNWAEVRTLIKYLDRKMLKLTLTKDDPQIPLVMIACVHNRSYAMIMRSPSCTWWRAIVNWQLIGQETSSFVKASDNNGTSALQLELTRQICRQKSRRREAKEPIWSKSKTDSSEFLPLSGWGDVVGGAKRGREKQVDPLPMRKRDRAKTSKERRIFFVLTQCTSGPRASFVPTVANIWNWALRRCASSPEKRKIFSIPHFKICGYLSTGNYQSQFFSL